MKGHKGLGEPTLPPAFPTLLDPPHTSAASRCAMKLGSNASAERGLEKYDWSMESVGADSWFSSLLMRSSTPADRESGHMRKWGSYNYLSSLDATPTPFLKRMEAVSNCHRQSSPPSILQSDANLTPFATHTCKLRPCAVGSQAL